MELPQNHVQLCTSFFAVLSFRLQYRQSANIELVSNFVSVAVNLKFACVVSHLAFFEVYIRPDGAMVQMLQGPCVVTQRRFRCDL
jgi:hypothetical protein